MKPLSRRERVRRCLNHEEPDRVPVDLGGRVSNIHKNAYTRLMEHFQIPIKSLDTDPFLSMMEIDPRLLALLGIDFQYLFLKGPEYTSVKKIEDGNDGYINEWGIYVTTLGIHTQRMTHPLDSATKADLKLFAWPDPTKPERVRGLSEKANRLYSETDYALVAAPVNGGIFEFGQHLRGMTQFLTDLMLDKSFANYLLDCILDVQIGLWEAFLAETGDKVEIVQLADDFGTQKSLMISPSLFREMFKPRYLRLINAIKKRTNAKVFFHCDGAITKLIGDFIEIGVDILNPLQPTADGMIPKKIKDEFGDQLVFHGAIDNQYLLPNGTPQEIQQNVRDVIQALAPGGGYILASAHVLEPDIPTENILAMFEAAKTFGDSSIR